MTASNPGPVVSVPGMNQAQTENSAVGSTGIEGNLNACPFVKSEQGLVAAVPVWVNTAELQHVPPDHGPAVCVVGAFPELTSAPRGVGALSAYGLAESNV